MPNWKKIALSGSSPEFSSLSVDNSITAGSLTGSLGYSNLTSVPSGIVSGSIQIDISSTTGYSTFSSSIDSHLDANISALSSSAHTQRTSLISNLSSSVDAHLDANITALSSSVGADIVTLNTFSSSLQSTQYNYTGSFSGDGSGLTGVVIPGAISSSAQFTTASDPFTGSFTGSFKGDGSQLTNISAGSLTTVSDTFTSATTHSVTHTFDTKDVNVVVYNSNDQLIIPASVTTTDASTVDLTFDTATTGRVVVTKGGHIVSGSIVQYIVSESIVSDTFTSVTSKTVTHNFGTKDVLVQVFNSNDDVIVPSRINTPNSSSVAVYFDVATSGRVVVGKSGHIVSGSSVSGTNLDLQAVTSSIIPVTNNTYDLGTPTKQFRHLYLSTASLYMDGTKVLSSTADTLTFTTDVGQSIKILETGADDITLQTDTGNIELKGTVEILSGKKITDSAASIIQFGDSLGITGSITLSGTVDGIDLQAFSASVATGLSNSTADFTQLSNNPFTSGSGAITASGHFVPSANETYDLGSNTLRWKDLYLSGSTIYLGDSTISRANIFTAGEISGSFTSLSSSLSSRLSGQENRIQRKSGNVTTQAIGLGQSGVAADNPNTSSIAFYDDDILVNPGSSTGGLIFSGSAYTNFAYYDDDILVNPGPSGGLIISGGARIASNGNFTTPGNLYLTNASSTASIAFDDGGDILVNPGPGGGGLIFSGGAATIASYGAVTASYFKGDGSALTGVVAAYSSLTGVPSGLLSGSAQITALTSYTQTFTSQTAVTASHNLGTKNVTVSVYGSDDYMIFPTSIKTHDTNNVYVQFNSSRSGRIVITK